MSPLLSTQRKISPVWPPLPVATFAPVVSRTVYAGCHQMRIPKPHWKASHQCYYAKIKGKFYRLDPDPKIAQEKFSELMFRLGTKEGAAMAADLKVRDLLDLFLEWVEKNREPETFLWYCGHLLGSGSKQGKHKGAGFANYVPEALLVKDLKPFHLHNWIQGRYAGASPNVVAGAITAVKRAFSWAANGKDGMGYIDASPLAGVRKPTCEGRDEAAFYLPDQWAQIMAAVMGIDDEESWETCEEAHEEKEPAFNLAQLIRDLKQKAPDARPCDLLKMLEQMGHKTEFSKISRALKRGSRKDRYRKEDLAPEPDAWSLLFLDYVRVLRETGCRPQEIRKVEARHLNHADKEWNFPRKESKGKKEPRTVHLGDVAYEICKRLAEKYPTGPLFRTRNARPWTAHEVSRRFACISKKVGFRVFAYAVRHTFASEAIIAGVDLITVARMMGHKDLSMLNKIYEHVTKDRAHIEESRRKATERSA